MVGRNGLLCLFLCYLVRFRGYEGDEFDATVDEKIACISCESHTGCSKDFGYDFLNGSYVLNVSIGVVQ